MTEKVRQSTDKVLKPQTLEIRFRVLHGNRNGKVQTKILVLVANTTTGESFIGAHKTLGFAYTPEQAEREWRMNRRTFKVEEKNRHLLELALQQQRRG